MKLRPLITIAAAAVLAVSAPCWAADSPVKYGSHIVLDSHGKTVAVRDAPGMLGVRSVQVGHQGSRVNLVRWRRADGSTCERTVESVDEVANGDGTTTTSVSMGERCDVKET